MAPALPAEIEAAVRQLIARGEHAEARGAFGHALGYLAKVERIDSLRPEVQRRRFRLLAGTVV